MMQLCLITAISLVSLTTLVSGAKHVTIANVAQSSDGSSMDRRDTGSNVITQLNLPTDADLEEKTSAVTAQGSTIKRFQETYKGIKIYDTVVDTETQDSAGNEDVVVGDYYVDLEEDLENSLGCEISNEAAQALILEYFKASDGKVENAEFEDMIYIGDSSVAKYTTQVSLIVVKETDLPMRLFGFVDKCKKNVLFAYDQSQYFTTVYPNNPPTTSTTTTTTTTTISPPSGPSPTTSPHTPANCGIIANGGNPKKSMPYGTSGYCLTPMDKSTDGTTCFLQNEYVKVVDLQNSNDASSTTVVSFPCSQGYSDPANGGLTAAYDTFYAVTKSNQMYRDWYNYEARKDNPPYAKVHYRQNFANAIFYGPYMVIGDGDTATYPWSTTDMVAHELGHGVVQENSNLEYREQSGGMNEAFADMAGEVTEEYAFGTTDFIMGNNLYKAPNWALRRFNDPTLDNKSIKHVSNFVNGMGVHFSSGIYNHVYWQMANVHNMGIRAAFECFLFANIIYWKSTTNFEAGACGTMQATYDRGYDMDVVKSSFAVVGITLQNCPDLSLLVTSSLTSGVSRNNLAVSKLRNPLYKMVVPSGTSSLTATVTGGVKVAISQSYKRSDTPLASGQGSATASVTAGSTVYVRVYKDDATEVSNVSLTATAS